MSERKLVTVRTIDEIRPIENADAIELAIVGGWQCVVKKGIHLAGELILYFEIDSWIPEHIAPFLSNGSKPKEFEGIVGFRLRIKKLRNTISQGLVLKIEDVFKVVNKDGASYLNIDEFKPSIYEDNNADIRNKESNNE